MAITIMGGLFVATALTPGFAALEPIEHWANLVLCLLTHVMTGRAILAAEPSPRRPTFGQGPEAAPHIHPLPSDRLLATGSAAREPKRDKIDAHRFAGCWRRALAGARGRAGPQTHPPRVDRYRGRRTSARSALLGERIQARKIRALRRLAPQSLRVDRGGHDAENIEGPLGH